MHPTKTPAGELRYPRCEAVLTAAQTNDLPYIVQHAQLRFLGHLLRRPPTDQTRSIFFSSISLPGRQGYADSNLLRVRLLHTLESLGIDISTAQNRDLWRIAIQPILHTFTDSRPLATTRTPQPPPPAHVPGARPPRKRVKA